MNIEDRMKPQARAYSMATLQGTANILQTGYAYQRSSVGVAYAETWRYYDAVWYCYIGYSARTVLGISTHHPDAPEGAK